MAYVSSSFYHLMQDIEVVDTPPDPSPTSAFVPISGETLEFLKCRVKRLKIRVESNISVTIDNLSIGESWTSNVTDPIFPNTIRRFWPSAGPLSEENYILRPLRFCMVDPESGIPVPNKSYYRITGSPYNGTEFYYYVGRPDFGSYNEGHAISTQFCKSDSKFYWPLAALGSIIIYVSSRTQVSNPSSYGSLIVTQRLRWNFNNQVEPSYSSMDGVLKICGESIPITCGHLLNVSPLGEQSHFQYTATTDPYFVIHLEPAEYWEFDPGDGDGPVWDKNTGNQLRNPFSIVRRPDGTFYNPLL